MVRTCVGDCRNEWWLFDSEDRVDDDLELTSSSSGGEWGRLVRFDVVPVAVAVTGGKCEEEGVVL